MVPSDEVQVATRVAGSNARSQPPWCTRSWQWLHSAIPLSTDVVPRSRHHRTWWICVHDNGRSQAGPRHWPSTASMAERCAGLQVLVARRALLPLRVEHETPNGRVAEEPARSLGGDDGPVGERAHGAGTFSSPVATTGVGPSACGDTGPVAAGAGPVVPVESGAVGDAGSVGLPP